MSLPEPPPERRTPQGPVPDGPENAPENAPESAPGGAPDSSPAPWTVPTGDPSGAPPAPADLAAHRTTVAFLADLTRLLLDTSGEGAEQVHRSVGAAARGLGAHADLVVVPDGATVTVTSHGELSTVTVRGFPEAFRMDQVIALKPLLADVSAGGLDTPAAARRLAAVRDAPQPYPWFLRLLGITLFAVGFAPLMQPTWYEVGTSAVLGAITATLAAASDLPRWALFLAWIVFTAGTVLAFAVPVRHLGPLLALVYATVGVQTGATKLVGEVGGTFVAAVALGAAATWLGARPRLPPRLVLLLPGFFTLTVGSLGLRGLTALAGGYPVEGFRDLTKLVTIVTAVALGLLVGAVAAEHRPGAAPTA
ncbi:threonine/serine exporter family protein [Streptomyces sp. NPDC021020]|uniref:threonine/serine exporter family protein n=1 Tax=Streptomyces sp. NPDC021020 TaxID=3365109 RepID=UPI0037B25303